MSELAKLSNTWRSERMGGREARLTRWGHFGRPVLIFPTAGGDSEEIERMHLVAALAPLVEAGRMKIYSCDSVAGQAMVTQEGTPQHRMWLMNMFHQYVRHEVVPAIRMDCRSDDLEILTAGASIGAFHAAAVVCRFPNVITKALCASGTYKLERFLRSSDVTEDFTVASPIHFLPHLGPGPHLDLLRTRYLLIASGEGRAEDIGESWALAGALGAKGIPNRVESWGKEWHHDWPTWREMFPKYLGDWT
jgi:esterase/lipase superfamily enzyme